MPGKPAAKIPSKNFSKEFLKMLLQFLFYPKSSNIQSPRTFCFVQFKINSLRTTNIIQLISTKLT